MNVGDVVMFDAGPFIGDIVTVKAINGERVIITDAYGDDAETYAWNLIPA